jgi:translation initiation factor 1A
MNYFLEHFTRAVTGYPFGHPKNNYNLSYNQEPARKLTGDSSLGEMVNCLTFPKIRMRPGRRLPRKGNREMFGCAELMMGANHIHVRCFDGVTRLGRITGKIKKKVWIREGDIPIVIPWNIQDEKCDIIYRYTGPQVE